MRAAIVASLHRQRALSHRWTHHAGIEDFSDSILQAQAPQSGRGENDGIVAAFIQFAQARVDVAANVFDLQIGTPRSKLRGAAQANRCPRERLARRSSKARPIRASRGSSRSGNGGQREAGRQIGGHIFEAVHGQIDRAGEQRLLNFLGEQAFRSHLRKRDVGDLVAGGLDNFDARFLPKFLQPGLNPVRLP